ncbi:MAG: toll/interleukin-1 receptor domain-containing protein [Planctomycetota bacterium]
MKRDTVFISYSHADSESRDELVQHLEVVLDPSSGLRVFADTAIETGEEWRRRIHDELDRSLVVVLLVSADFLTSDFVRDVELPRAALAARRGELVIASLHVRPSAVQHFRLPMQDSDGESFDFRLAEFQGINDPGEPVMTREGPDREAALLEAAEKILHLATSLRGGEPEPAPGVEPAALVTPAVPARLPARPWLRAAALTGFLALLVAWGTRHLTPSPIAAGAAVGLLALLLLVRRPRGLALRSLAGWALSTPVLVTLGVCAVLATLFVSSVTVIGADSAAIQLSAEGSAAQPGTVYAAERSAPPAAERVPEPELRRELQRDWEAAAHTLGERSGASTLRPGEVVKVTRFTTPFGRPLVLEVEGCGSLAIDLRPGGGERVRVPDDLSAKSSVLVRVPYLSRGTVADGSIHLYRVGADGEFEVLGIARTSERSASVLFGPARALPAGWSEARRTEWEAQMRAAGAEGSGHGEVFDRWASSVSAPLLHPIQSGDRLQAWYFPRHDRLGSAAGRAFFEATDDPIQDCLLSAGPY